VLEGEPECVSWKKSWPRHLVRRAPFLRLARNKSYKMHIRVLLSKYRAYTPCTAATALGLSRMRCYGGWGRRKTPMGASAGKRFMPQGAKWSDARLAALPA